MKRDMTGGAVVIVGAWRRSPRVGCPVRVTGLVAAAENAIGGDAMRPGDVIRHYGGRTTEVTNTDAEGRLVLADALAYAVAELDPDVARRRRHPHRRDEGRARPAARRPLRQPTTPLADALARGRRGRRASRCGGFPLVGRLRGAPRLQGRRRRQRPRHAGRDHRRAVPPALRRRACPWAHLDVASVGDAPERQRRVDQRARPASAPALLLDWLDRTDPLAGMSMKGLTVRWSLDGRRRRRGRGELAAYVADTSHARFTGKAGPALQDLADAAGRVVRGLLRLRQRRGARGVPGDLRRRAPRSRRARRSSAARRS